MPNRPPTHHELLHGKRDPESDRAYYRRRSSDAADRASKRFYASVAWTQARDAQLRRAPLCVDCERAGLTTAATVVDHVTPIKRGGARVAPSNLQSLCVPHHAAKTSRETNEARS